ncbi:conserved hypothetical protein, YbaK/prolyl-tRNA synthetase associated region [gamma proteobacterium HdN1]|nr:conserved hypothetical protein, YbaK/prolyl-tRNA synthetase associated region [gamma proteobacterium HdN1]
MLIRSINEYFEKNAVRYHACIHPYAVTAPEVAEVTHISGQHLAKTVVLNADHQMVMAVLPADRQVDLAALRSALGATKLELAKEEDFAGLFPDCDPGGIPPFGNLYDMQVVLEQSLADQAWLAFSAGSHTVVVKMDVAEFIQLANPLVCSFTCLH